MITAVLSWFYSFFGAFFSALMGMSIAEGVSVGSLMIVMSIFLLVVSNLILIAKRN